MSAVLLVRLKITDLTAWTALESGRRLLGPGYALERVAREQLYLFEPAPGTRPDVFEGALEEAVRSSNFFVNPNRESFRFLRAESRGARWSPPEGAWGIVARARGETSDEGLKARLLREHPLEGLHAIRRAKVWWLWTRGPDGSLAVSECHRVLGTLVSPSHGLLVNPHAEASLLLEGEVPWGRVEEFLKDESRTLSEAA